MVNALMSQNMRFLLKKLQNIKEKNVKLEFFQLICKNITKDIAKLI